MGNPKTNSSDVVYAAAIELRDCGQMVTRQTLKQATGLEMSVIDDRLKVLVDDGLLLRIERGVFQPMLQYPSMRAISKTVVNGWVKLDVGDTLLTLTPQEAMHLGRLFMGDAMMLSNIEMGNQFSALNGATQRELKQLRAQVGRLEASKSGELFADQGGGYGG
ncbi:hypothetical protein [Kingella negevensis]|uniref:hypothetical protein n=1 Tax=Kingella negevensis TaxID=1522312 RepID=UPI00050A1A13|nr:hypothetical protein [Kingella negevensis]